MLCSKHNLFIVWNSLYANISLTSDLLHVLTNNMQATSSRIHLLAWHRKWRFLSIPCRTCKAAFDWSSWLELTNQVSFNYFRCATGSGIFRTIYDVKFVMFCPHIQRCATKQRVLVLSWNALVSLAFDSLNSPELLCENIRISLSSYMSLLTLRPVYSSNNIEGKKKRKRKRRQF